MIHVYKLSSWHFLLIQSALSEMKSIDIVIGDNNIIVEDIIVFYEVNYKGFTGQKIKIKIKEVKIDKDGDLVHRIERINDEKKFKN